MPKKRPQFATEWRCVRCHHAWLSRKPETVPVICPKCKSPYWNRAKQGAKTA